jgi:hypothetical protein
LNTAACPINHIGGDHLRTARLSEWLGSLLAEYTFALNRWHCWASGIAENQPWQRWIEGRISPAAGETPALEDIKPIQRRRLSAVARGAFHCAQKCLLGRNPIATIFCSAHGEGPRAADLLESIARGDALSPNAFSLSVHNAIAGLFGIFTHDDAPSTSIAAGAEGVGAAFLDAWCRLQAHDGEVLVVLYDDQMPDVFSVGADAPPVPLAAAFLLSNDSQGAHYRLERRAPNGGHDAHWQQIRSLVNFLQAGLPHLSLQSERARWTWTAL